MTIDDKVSMFYGAEAHIFEKAKFLRKNMTKAEMLLWERLKGKKCWGYVFVHSIQLTYLSQIFIVIL